MKTKVTTLILAAAALIAAAACTNDDNVAVDNNAPVAARITAGMADDAVATPSVMLNEVKHLQPQSTGQEVLRYAQNDSGNAQNDNTPSTRAVGDRWNRDHIGVVVTNSPGSDMATRYRNARYATNSVNISADFAPNDAANTIYFADPDETVTFWAYAPYQPSVTPDALPGTNGVVTVDATKQATPDEQEAIDFISAEPATASKANPTVVFKFHHIMSRLVLKIETPAAYGFDPDDVKRISRISLGGLCTGGTLDFSTRLHAFDPATWTSDWDIAGCVHNVGPDKNNVMLRTHTLIFFPQQASDMNGTPLNAVPITITLDGQKYTNDTDISGNTNAAGHFSPSTSYEYTIRLKKSTLEVTGATITDWTDGGSASGDATPQP